jgi:electron transport complex protein RnfB
MSEEVYTQLRKFLDNMPGCFPTTESGVEMKILKKLFTTEQAEITMKLTPMPEPVSQIAPRLGMREEEAAEKLEELAKEGSILRLRAGEVVHYAAVSFVVGIYEFHVGTIDRELAEYMEEYFPYIAKAWESVGTKQLRVVPIEAALQDEKKVGTYAQIRELIKDKQLISVAPCICAKEKHLVGEPCSRPEERCIQFDMAAQYFIENGLSRQITQEELMDLLKMGEEKALVLSPGNSKEIINICLCCGCCCGFMGVLKRFDRPADHCGSPYQAKIDPEACVMCGTCEDRCQMEAIKEGDGAYEVEDARCIGCGLCVPTCPEEAIAMVEKPEAPSIPDNLIDMNMKIAQERGLM